MSLQPHLEYADCDLAEIARIPTHWFVARMDSVTTTSRDGIVADQLAGKTVFHYSIPVVQETGDGQLEDGDAISSSKLVISEPQVLISKLNPRKGTVCIASPREELTVGSGEFVPLIPRGADLCYLCYLVQSDQFRQRLEARVESATRSHQRVLPSHITKAHWCFPPLAEQCAIARFLDRETAKIDALVAEQRRLVALLKEKRQAVISHAVTKGLDPNAKMKPSGIEWLGDVPEGWEVKRLKFLSDIQTGGRDTVDAVDDGLYPFFVRSQTVERINSMSFDCEAVLTAGDGVGVGKVFHYYDGPFDFHQRVYMFNNFRDTSGKFFFHYLQANFYKVALEGGAKSTVDSLRRPMLANFWICVPSPAEQSQIVDYVETEIVRFDSLTAETSRAIQLLQERRTALISAAVTGKIDVRGLVAEGVSA